MRDIRIALVVVNCPVAAVGENLASVERLAGEAAREGAEIVCFPELNLTGYCVAPDLTKTALPVPGPATEEMVRIARSTSLTILAGLAEKDPDGRMYATHLVVTPQGVSGSYRKIHIAPPERSPFFPRRAGFTPFFARTHLRHPTLLRQPLPGTFHLHGPQGVRSDFHAPCLTAGNPRG